MTRKTMRITIDDAMVAVVQAVLRLNGQPNATADDAAQQIIAAIRSMQGSSQGNN